MPPPPPWPSSASGWLPLDLRPIDAALLVLLDAAPEVTHSEAAETLGLRRPNLVPVVAGLEKRGLLERKRLDFRSEGLVLTDNGRSLLNKARTGHRRRTRSN